MSTELGPQSPRPVVLDIPGDWWDCFLYAGRLYLITIDGDVHEVHWPRLIGSLAVRPRDRLAMELSFIDARFLYGRDWERLVRDEEIRELLTDKINRIAANPIEVEPDVLAAATTAVHRALPEALSDLDIFRNRIYTASEEGEHALRHRLDRGAERQWDGETVRVSASRGVLAVAAGMDGLRQTSLLTGFGRRVEEPWKVLAGDFSGCSWLSSSIYASSHANAGALAVFSQQRRQDPNLGRRQVRTFEAAVDDELLFDDTQRKRLDDIVAESLPPDEPQNAATRESTTEAASDAPYQFESRYTDLRRSPPRHTDSRGLAMASFASLGGASRSWRIRLAQAC